MTRSFLVPLSKSVPELQSDRSDRDPIAHLVILLVGEVSSHEDPGCQAGRCLWVAIQLAMWYQAPWKPSLPVG